MYWYNLTINSKSLKHIWSGVIEFRKFVKQQLFVCQPAVRPTGARHMGPILSITKVLAACNTDLLFEEDCPLCHDASFHPSKFYCF